MSQLVSARLLIGPGRLSTVPRAIHTPFRDIRHFSCSELRSRSAEPRFFSPSFSHFSGQTCTPLQGIFSSRTRSQHIAAGSSAYAPPSDDPFVTAKVPGGTSAERELLLQQSLTPSQALAAGYRPVPSLTLHTLPRIYRQLAKAQLTFLVTLTGMAGYALCPASLASSASLTTLLSMSLGTALCSASANSLNQLVEAPYDAQMPRTRNRPLPSRSITPLHAATFAAACGTAGVGALASINGVTASLGLANILLYSGVYTPTKRVTIANTWVGSIVGAIPPLIGWSACTGTLGLASDLPGWSLAALMFAWQFPHFNSLAHTLRREYARGGYRMMSVTNPALNRRTSLRYAISLIPICSVLLPWTGVVHWTYSLLSAPINAALIYSSYGFWRHDGDKAARTCFFVSLIHLPAVLLLAMACKTDVIKGIRHRLGWQENGAEP